MDILKIANEWVRAEIFSSKFFIYFAFVFLIASLLFWQLGKTEIARAYIIPTLVAGVLLMIIGIGLVYNNMQRKASFEKDYRANPVEFVEAELKRADGTLKEYKTIVFTAIPIIIAVCALMLLIFSGPGWRASMITTLAFLVVLLLVDGTAQGRIAAYNEDLEVAIKELRK